MLKLKSISVSVSSHLCAANKIVLKKGKTTEENSSATTKETTLQIYKNYPPQLADISEPIASYSIKIIKKINSEIALRIKNCKHKMLQQYDFKHEKFVVSLEKQFNLPTKSNIIS